MNYRVIMARQKSCENRWKKVNGDIGEFSGIYALIRIDEAGIKYAYIGQAKNIQKRLGQHLLGYQHIDLSLKKHKLFDVRTNPYGWDVKIYKCPVDELDDWERKYIRCFADSGFQLRNKTAGGQDTGKIGIDENRPSKGYYDGLKQGYENCRKEVKEYFDKYLDFIIKSDSCCFKKDGSFKEIYKKKHKEFKEFLEVKGNE